MEQIEELQFTATLSMPATGQDWLWKVLSHNLPTNHWRAARSGNMIASVHHRRDELTNKSSYKQILATGYIAEEPSAVSNNNNTQSSYLPAQNSIPFFTRDWLDDQKSDTLSELCKKYNIPKKVPFCHHY